MRKTLLFILLFSLIAVGLVACGGSSGGALSGQKQQPSISISPMNPNLLVGQSMQFTANIQNLSDTRVSWTVQEEKGGTIASTDTGGLYTAPWPVGIYHVVATSVADTSLTTNTMVSVTAKFAFIEQLPSGDALPFSMTPMIGTVGTDGNIGITGITQKSTGTPVSVAMESLTLSNDGTKGTFSVWAPDNTYDVFVANADGTGDATQLTLDGNSWWPEFSPDGQQVIYIHGYDIWAMNVNGSNQHLVFSSTLNNAYGVDAASFSPDGTQIVAELEDWTYGGNRYNGIAIMNADGTNAVPLTGGPDLLCAGWDEMPSFTHEGTQIMFTRYCYDDNVETMYTINTDGTRLTPLLAATAGVWHYNPVAVADNIILFQTNRDFPNTTAFEIYSMKADGSGLTKLTNNPLFDGFDDRWFSWSSSSSLQALAPASRSAMHGAAARAERIKHLRQHGK